MVKSVVSSRSNYPNSANSNNNNSNNNGNDPSNGNLLYNPNVPHGTNSLSNLHGSNLTNQTNIVGNIGSIGTGTNTGINPGMGTVPGNSVVRQESLGTLLNNYTTNFNNVGYNNKQSISGFPGNGGVGSISGIPSNVMMPPQQQQQPPPPSSSQPPQHQQQQQQQQPPSSSMQRSNNSFNTSQQVRFDSISLPPLSSNQFKTDEPAGSGSNGANIINSRSNSIFNLMQFPNSNNNSISGETFNPKLSRQVSTLDPNIMADIESFLNNPNNYNQSRQNSQDRKASKSSKNSSIDLSNWENYNNFIGNTNGNVNPTGTTGTNGAAMSNSNSLSGSLSNLLHGLNNMVDLSNMSAEQRRDSVIKFVSDPQSMQYLQQFYQNQQNGTNLRQDMFKGEYEKKDSIKNDNIQNNLQNNSLKPPNPPLSPTSSLSSKSDVKHEVPQSPKTSPNYSSSNVPQFNLNQMSQPYTKNFYQGQPQGQLQSQNQNQTPAQVQYYNTNYQPVPLNNSYGSSSSQQSQSRPQTQYISPSYTNFQNNYPNNMPDAGVQKVNNDKQRIKALPIKTKILSDDVDNLPPPIQAREGEKPLLGATKIDQLMLVIQSRDKENGNDVKYTTAKDGTIIGEIEPQHLVGGVEKQKLEEESDDDGTELDKEGRRKRKKKTPQCPYCHKYFAQTTQLEVHVRSHIGYKPFECSYCHKRFTQGGNLTTHLRLHTGEKPFTCEICNKSFSRKGNLAAHKLTHDNLKPFDCKLDNCDKSFTQLGNLKSHQNKFHLDTLNNLTIKLTELSSVEISQLPKHEQEMLEYFKNLYKNSNKGIKGRGKTKKDDTMSSLSPPTTTTNATTTNNNNATYANSNNLNYNLEGGSPNANPGRLDNYGGPVFMNNNYDLNYRNQ